MILDFVLKKIKPFIQLHKNKKLQLYLEFFLCFKNKFI